MYRREVDGKILDFDHCGYVYQRSFVMFDKQTESEWLHLTAECVMGPLKGKTLDMEATRLTTRTNETDLWRYVVWQNYWGNPGDGASIWVDDPYIRIGTPARIERGDQALWNQSAHREIQIPTAWTDTSISVRVNRGSFKKGDPIYLFVVNADGEASAGRRVSSGFIQERK